MSFIQLGGGGSGNSSPAPSNPNDILETTFLGANNQVTPVDITGFLFLNSSIRSFEALVSIHVDASSSLFERYKLYGIQNGSSWTLNTISSGDDSQITFSITNAGQIQYTSGNYSGFNALTIKFRAETTST